MSEETEQVSPAKPERKKFGWGLPVIIGAFFAIILNMFFVNIYVVPSASMDPTLKVGDYILSVPALDNRQAPQRGDIVVFHPPASWDQPDGTIFVKRVIAVGGDTVECCSVDGKVKVNGQAITEPYAVGDNANLPYSYKVPQGTVFVLGDNRDNSADSRYHAEHFVPLNDIVGQPLGLIYPLDRMKTLDTVH